MNRTIQISDGKIVTNENGIVETVSGPAKGAQDLARHVLSAYSPFWDEGNEVIGNEGSSSLDELVVEQYIYDSVNRLISIQSQNFRSESDDSIDEVEQLLTRKISNGNLVFYLQVRHLSGELLEVVDQLNRSETQLNHTIDLSGISEV